MDLLHWPGDYGLASIDVDCLHVMERDLEEGLDGKVRADILAFTTLVETKLKPAVLYLSWVDSENFTKVSRKWYANVLPFPLNYVVPGKLHRQANSYVEASYNLDEKAIGIQVLNTAKCCIDLLADRLGELNFFCGNRPTSLDAIVYAYLAIICKIQLHNNILKPHLQRYPNLINLVDRIHRNYFPSKEEPSTPSVSSSDFRLVDKLYFAGMAIGATLAYTVLSGFVTIAAVDEDEDEDDMVDFDDE
ncbi:uncharacterized protein TRIADDRAFT_56159 [Trichoplax adhaerens]|uniref:Metaxin n=1 Tax=Trichoplax adhaerens TaxID=10228 RepID=B3RXC3_TRIAD|nr:hypothetical protein TRIADDRAFT_56159 [Trichoplax adhaerens]EDV24392.1 hypothetical protein TRIADDRAFT_56159 [Trichoplax adhaerens]|eukprot:XP_002112282.1 hypothetical protein TRIADDRAFT_56159 [Trichoplax adhaerens]